MQNKCLLVGRHADADIGIEIVEHVDMKFPKRRKWCLSSIHHLFTHAVDTGADCIVFQGLPGQANAALWSFMMAISPDSPFKKISVGQAVSKPGPRPKDETRAWTLGRLSTYLIFENALKWANPNISIETDIETNTITATATPPMPFVFSHIEWLPHATAEVEVH